MHSLPVAQEMSRFSFTGTIWVMVVTSLSGTAAEHLAEEQSSPHMEEEWLTVVLAIVSSAILLSILVFALFNCTDCYKSEVSTECHPATASSGAKWGGADSYSGAGTSDMNRSVLDVGFTSEVISPGERDSQPLPYALIPSQVPEAQGFRGYAPVEQATAPGLRGYGAVGGGGSMTGYGGGGGQWGGAGQEVAGYGYGREWGRANTGGHDQHLPGAHISPSLTEEPPPPYYAPSFS